MKLTRRLFAATLFATFAVAPFSLQAQTDHVQSDIDPLVSAMVERARKEFNVPGMAVAIVKDGHVVLAKGYGVRKLGDSAPVTADTLFGIASNSKAFTSAAIALLIDEHKLAWNDRVVDKLPEFAMSDAYVTREMRIRDLLCHRSGLGLGAGDLMFFPRSDLTADQIIYRLRFIPLATSFRSEYAYDNILYTVAGAVIQRVSGRTWQQFMRERFFEPLEMKSTRPSINDVTARQDVAYPHVHVNDALTALPLDTLALDNSAPAGAIVSSVNDMSKWVATLLRSGRLPDGKTLISSAQMRELWRPATILPNGVPPPALTEGKTNFSSYAMGEQVREYRGELMITHTGGLLGMVTQVSMLPEKNIGVIVFTNQMVGAAFDSVSRTIFDHYLLDQDHGAPSKDWIGAYAGMLKTNASNASSVVEQAFQKRNAQSKSSLALESYAGRYRDPWYGDVLIEARDGKLSIRFTHNPALTGTLEHFQYDTFVARWKDRSLDADAYVTFSLNPAGTIAEVKMKAVSPTTDFSFDFHDLALKPAAASSPAW